MKLLYPGVHEIYSSQTYLLDGPGDYTVRMYPHDESIKVVLLVLGQAHDQYCVSLVQQHDTPDSSSESYLCGILSGSARLEITSLAHIAALASGAKAHQSAQVVLVSPQATARTQPAVEIRNREVSCTHASSIGQLDAQVIEYLGTKGLEVHDAKVLLVRSAVASYTSDEHVLAMAEAICSSDSEPFGLSAANNVIR